MRCSRDVHIIRATRDRRSMSRLHFKHTLFAASVTSLALLCASCLRPKETTLFSKFSVRDLVERNKASAGLKCDVPGGGNGGGGGGGSDFTITSGGRRGSYSSSRGDSFACQLNDDSKFDEQRFVAALKVDAERLLRDSGAQIVESGAPGPAKFYFSYAVNDVHGRVEVSATRGGMQYYYVHASLNEGN